MALRTPPIQLRSQFGRSWGNFADPESMPNAPGAPLGLPFFSILEVGDTAYSVSDGATYTCVDVGTAGGGDAEWTPRSLLPFVEGYISGRYYPLGLGEYGNALGTLAGFADRLDLYLFRPFYTITPTELGCYVSTPVVAAQYKMLAYASDGPLGTPSTQIYVSPAVDASINWSPEVAGLPTFRRGYAYWIGIVNSSTATVRALPLTSTLTFGGLGTASPPAGAIVGTVIRRVAAGQFAAPPAPFGPVLSTEIANNITPPALIALAP